MLLFHPECHALRHVWNLFRYLEKENVEAGIRIAKTAEEAAMTPYYPATDQCSAEIDPWGTHRSADQIIPEVCLPAFP